MCKKNDNKSSESTTILKQTSTEFIENTPDIDAYFNEQVSLNFNLFSKLEFV